MFSISCERGQAMPTVSPSAQHGTAGTAPACALRCHAPFDTPPLPPRPPPPTGPRRLFLHLGPARQPRGPRARRHRHCAPVDGRPPRRVQHLGPRGRSGGGGCQEAWGRPWGFGSGAPPILLAAPLVRQSHAALVVALLVVVVVVVMAVVVVVVVVWRRWRCSLPCVHHPVGPPSIAASSPAPFLSFLIVLACPPARAGGGRLHAQRRRTPAGRHGRLGAHAPAPGGAGQRQQRKRQRDPLGCGAAVRCCCRAFVCAFWGGGGAGRRSLPGGRGLGRAGLGRAGAAASCSLAAAWPACAALHGLTSRTRTARRNGIAASRASGWLARGPSTMQTNWFLLLPALPPLPPPLPPQARCTTTTAPSSWATPTPTARAASSRSLSST